MHFGLREKKLSWIVFDVGDRARKPCLSVITSFTQGELILIPFDDRKVACDENRVNATTCEVEIKAWVGKDMDAQTHIIKYIGASKYTLVRNRKSAFEMWISLKAFYESQGEVEVANCTPQRSAITMIEAEDITTYVRRLEELHSLLGKLSQPQSKQQTCKTRSTLSTRRC